MPLRKAACPWLSCQWVTMQFDHHYDQVLWVSSSFQSLSLISRLGECIICSDQRAEILDVRMRIIGEAFTGSSFVGRA
jgi:hypothetical protein